MKYAGLVTIALALALSAPASATVFKGVPHGALTGNLNTDAQWSSTTGCLDRNVDLFANKQPDGSTSVGVGIEVWDHCNNVPVVERGGGADLAPGEFQIDQNRTLATLHATIPTWDFLSGDYENPPPAASLDVDLTWTGAGKLQPPTLIRYGTGHADGLTIVNLDHEVCRPSTLSGTMIDEGDGTDYAQGPVSDQRMCEQIAGSVFLFVFVNP